MEDQQRQLAMVVLVMMGQGSQAHVPGGGRGSSGVRWTGQTVALVAAVAVCMAIVGGLTRWLLQ
jgi:hypothetical protein